MLVSASIALLPYATGCGLLVGIALGASVVILAEAARPKRWAKEKTVCELERKEIP